MRLQGILVHPAYLADIQRWPVFRTVDLCACGVDGIHALRFIPAFQHVPRNLDAFYTAGAFSLDQYPLGLICFGLQYLLHLVYVWFHG